MKSAVDEGSAPAEHYYLLCLANKFKQDITSDPAQVGLSQTNTTLCKCIDYRILWSVSRSGAAGQTMGKNSALVV